MISFANKNYFRGWVYNKPQWWVKFNNIILHYLYSKYIYSFMIKSSKLYCICISSMILMVSKFTKNFGSLNTECLTDIVVVDNPNSLDCRFTINYFLLSYVYNHRMVIRTFTNIVKGVRSLTYYYNSANWLEREAWDMYGVKFLLHPDLRRILTDYGFQGHPLRKDFPLIGFTELRYDDGFKSICVEPVEMTQDYRVYKFNNGWINWK